MTTLHNLTPAAGSITHKKRVGRGEGSGKGGQSTRGRDGAGSRSGHQVRHRFEGGQTSLFRRVPKMPKPNHIKVTTKVLNLGDLEKLATQVKSQEITPELLASHGKIKLGEPYKVLANGTLKNPLTIKAHDFSQAARTAIEKTKGQAITL